MSSTQLKQFSTYDTLILIAFVAILILAGVAPPYLSILLIAAAAYLTYNTQVRYRDLLRQNKAELSNKTAALMSAQKREQQQQLAFESLVNILPASVFFTSKDLTVQSVNKTCQQWFERPNASLVGQHLKQIIGDESCTEFELLGKEAQQQGQPITFEMDIRTLDQSVRTVDITVMPVEQNLCLFFLQDKPGKKAGHAEIEKMRKALEIQEEEKNNFKEKMLEVNKELQQFASVASHDMKEPLRTISSFSNLLARRITKDERSQEFLNFISDSAKRMTQLLDDLINYARTGLEQQPRQSVRMMDVVLTVRNNLYAKMEETKTEIIAENLPTLNAHFTALTQIVQNIISNSIKFQKEHNTPTIKINTTYTDSTCIVSISDNGIGMEEKYHKQIFEPFRRLHSRLEYEGSGIGLATCKKIMDEYRGKLTVESQLGTGTTFHLTFPLDMVSNPEVSVECAA